MNIVYADPPYVGQSEKHYADHPDFGGEVDHRSLLRLLRDEADGWVLHMSTPSIPHIAGIVEDLEIDARWMAWVKPFAAFKANVSVAYAWEPVLVKAARKPVVSKRTIYRDWLDEPMTLKRGLAGAKPDAVCRWLFDMMGAEPDDTFVDVFPGTGAVVDAWLGWCEDYSNPHAVPPARRRMDALPKWAQRRIQALEAQVHALGGEAEKIDEFEQLEAPL